jgi:hypothetical protein
MMYMESPSFIRATATPSDLPKNKNHNEAITSFESHRLAYEQYAGHSIHIAPAPEDLDTFAFDLKTNTIYLNDKFYSRVTYGELGTAFATFHEIEHFKEKIALLQEKDGAKVFTNYLNKLDEKISKHAGAYGVLDNCIADVRENGAVLARTPHKGFDEVEKNLYKDVQFPNVDFTQDGNRQPLHIQLPYAIINEYRSGRQCIVDARVRKILDELQHTALPNGKEIDIISVMTNPNPKVMSMSQRLAIQDAYVFPKVLELLEEDMKEEKQKKGKAGDGDGSQHSGKKKDGDGAKMEDGKGGSESTPNEVFKEAYEEAKKRVPNAVPLDVQRKAVKEWVEENGDEEKKKNQALAEKLGVKVGALKSYKDILKKLQVTNPETKESLIDDLENLIKRIISKRLKEKQMPKYPVEDGDELVDPATWLAEVRGGNFEPKVWEDTEIVLKKDKKFGEVEITLVCDRSGSMEEGVKCREQQKALVLFMEALKRFNDILDDEEINVEKPLSIKSEIYTFQADGKDGTPIKKMGKVLTEKERIESCAVVASTPGNSTTDFVPLEAIATSMSDDTCLKIQEGELKKIIIVFTDGGSDNPTRVQNVLKELQTKGVVVIGVGITESGTPALTTYTPRAVLAKQAGELSKVLGDILKEHLEEV